MTFKIKMLYVFSETFQKKLFKISLEHKEKKSIMLVDFKLINNVKWILINYYCHENHL